MPFSKLVKRIAKPLGISYIINPVTIGEKLRNRRLELRLLQKEVANIMDVSEDTITNWENNHTDPSKVYKSKIIQFLRSIPGEANIYLSRTRVEG